MNVAGSIRRRLTVQLVGSAAVLAGILFLVVQNLANQLAEQSQDNILAASVTSILDSIYMQNGEVAVDIPYSAFSMLGNISDDRVFYRIALNGETLTGYGTLPDAAPGRGIGQTGFVTTEFDGESVRLATARRPLTTDRGPVELLVSVAQTRTAQARVLADISRKAAFIGMGFFAVAAVLAILAAQSAVAPLTRVAMSISRRGPQDLRPVQAPVPAEMGPLVSALNRLMSRLKTTLNRSEDFIAEAAHRVRTPLATVRTQAEVAMHRAEDATTRAALRDMIRAVDESSRAAGQLLDHAMITFRADRLVPEPLDLAGLVADTVERLRPVAGLRDIRLVTELPGSAPLEGDAILIQNAVRNVLDNAIKYAPEDSLVSVALDRADGEWQIAVADTGAGFPPGDPLDLTERFARGANTRGAVGSGLGLTIARDVAAAHGGRLSIDTRHEGGGACVRLHFPLS